MVMMRWEPGSEAVSLREAMDRLLAESFVRPGSGRGGDAAALAMDVEERGDTFVLTVPVPGIKPDDVEISVLGDTVRVRGERQEERREDGEEHRWLLREQHYGAFERAVTLPCLVKADQASAEFNDGLLTITLPKAEEAKEKRIPVRAAGQRREVPIEATSEEGKNKQSADIKKAST